MIVIYETDEQYGKRLFNYLISKCSNREEFVFFSSIDKLIEVNSSKKIEVLLIDEKGYELLNGIEESIDIQIEKIIILSTRKDMSFESNQRTIYKYQKASAIYSELNKLKNERDESFFIH